MKAAGRVSYKKLRWGRRVKRKGHYYQQILDAKGRRKAEVPWHPALKEELRAVQKAAAGEATRRVREVLGYRVSGWKLESVDRKTGEPTFTKSVWRGRTPIGEPGGRVTGAREGRSGRWLGRCFENMDPGSWLYLLEQAAGELSDPRHAYLIIRVRGSSADGSVHGESALHDVPLSEVVGNLGLLRALLADALSKLGQNHGYGGRVTALEVTLSLVLLSEAYEGRVIYKGKVVKRGRRKT